MDTLAVILPTKKSESQRSREWRQRNPETARETNKNYYQNHKLELRESRRIYMKDYMARRRLAQTQPE